MSNLKTSLTFDDYVLLQIIAQLRLLIAHYILRLFTCSMLSFPFLVCSLLPLSLLVCSVIFPCSMLNIKYSNLAFLVLFIAIEITHIRVGITCLWRVFPIDNRHLQIYICIICGVRSYPLLYREFWRTYQRNPSSFVFLNCVRYIQLRAVCT